MGIDKPNIRWIVHWGVPQSIEAYYQQVGRAGRDRGEAHCTVVLTEFDEVRNRQLLAEDVGLEEVRERCSDRNIKRSERDDVTTQLYFQFRSFPGVDDEVAALAAVTALVEPAERAKHVSIPWRTNDEQDQRERAIYRLSMLGVVGDYTVDWGSRAFTLDVKGTTPDAVRDAFLRYVERTQPGRVDAMRAIVASQSERKLEDVVVATGRSFVEFIYDTIERSRRRSMREMYLAVKESTSDEELRARVLDFLSEGDVAPAMERLVDRPRYHFAEWAELLDGVRAEQDAGELRGAAGRLLASAPDHPGLLYARAIAEVTVRDGSFREFDSNVRAAFESARDRYGASVGDIEAMARDVLRRASSRGSAFLTAAVAIVEDHGLDGDDSGLSGSYVPRTPKSQSPGGGANGAVPPAEVGGPVALEQQVRTAVDDAIDSGGADAGLLVLEGTSVLDAIRRAAARVADIYRGRS
jgi:ATP-dependent DNA helicase RecQ